MSKQNEVTPEEVCTVCKHNLPRFEGVSTFFTLWHNSREINEKIELMYIAMCESATYDAMRPTERADMALFYHHLRVLMVDVDDADIALEF